MTTRCCKKCGTNDSFKWCKGLCSSCYTKSRDLKCIKCENNSSSRWYKGPTCNTCRNKEYYENTPVTDHSPCETCQKTKSLYWYGKICSSCYKKAHYQKNKKNSGLMSEIKEYQFTHNRTARNRFTTSKYRAKNERELEWDISFSEYSELINKPCYYCNKDTSEETGCGLDRKNNDLGYNLANVLPCCGSCNRIRNCLMTVEEMKFIMEQLIVFRGAKKC